MTELREVRARKISSPSSSLIFPLSRQKKSQNRHPREEKNSERKKRLKFEFWFQCDITCKRLWVNTETRDSPPSLAPAKLSSHTKKKLGKKQKTHQKIQKKKSTHETKKFPPPFSRPPPPPPPHRLDQNCARFMSSS